MPTFPHPLLLTDTIKLDGIPSKVKSKLQACCHFISSFMVLLIKRYSHQFFISCYFLAAFTSTDTMFYNFSELHATLSEKRFPSQVSFFYQIHPNPPNPFDCQNPKSTKHEESFFYLLFGCPTVNFGLLPRRQPL